jgi:putative FmdB family regulatory protein
VPIYEYVCSACHHRADILHGIYEEGPAFCPSCGAEGTMRKAFAAPAVHFKGTGWAKKERSSGSMTKAAAAESAGEKSADDKSSGDKSSGDKSSGDKSSGDKTASDSGDTASKSGAATSTSTSEGGD